MSTQSRNATVFGLTGDQWQRYGGRLTLIGIAAAVAWWGRMAVLSDAGDVAARDQAVYTSGAIVLLLIWGFFVLTRGGVWAFQGLFTGQDDRPSTSLFQFFLWTVVAIYAFVSVFAARHARGLVDAGIEVPPYLMIAMGLSLSTTAVAKGITSYYVNTGRLVKTPPASSATALPSQQAAGSTGGAATGTPAGPAAATPQPGATRPVSEGDAAKTGTGTGVGAKGRFSHIFLGDNDQPDLTKIQMLAWTFVAVGAYLVTVWATLSEILDPATTPARGFILPDIPLALMVLTGLGLGTYLGTKVILASTPQVTGIAPDAGDETTQFVLTGVGFGETQRGSLIYLDDHAIAVSIPPASWSDERIAFPLPAAHPDGRRWAAVIEPVAVQVAVGGQLSNAVRFRFRPPTIGDLTPRQGGVATPIVLTGRDLGNEDIGAILIDGATTPVSVGSWSGSRIEFTLPAARAAGSAWPTARTVLQVAVRVGGQTSNGMRFTFQP